MAKENKKKFGFSVTLLSANKPTINGHIYSLEVLERLSETFTKSPSIIIQEMNEVERKVKKIPFDLPWMNKIMADVVSGEIINGNLVIYAQCRDNREGRKLEGVIKNIGIKNIRFFPVGYGEVDKNKVIKPNYKLNYIALEPKNIKVPG